MPPSSTRREEIAVFVLLTVILAPVLSVAIAAFVWRRWREPMLVAVAVAGEVAIFLTVTMLVDRARPPVRLEAVNSDLFGLVQIPPRLGPERLHVAVIATRLADEERLSTPGR